MDKDTKTLILAVFVILIIAVMGIVFKGVGYATKEPVNDAFITLNSKIVFPGENIHINVLPGENGIAKAFTIRRANGIRSAQTTLHCNSYCCRNEMVETYKIPSNWKGDYYLEFNDCKGNKEVVTVDFEVLP